LINSETNRSSNQIAQLKREERIGISISYENSLHSLLKYDPKISFEAVTVDYLREYEQAMIKAGKTKTTVGVYIRALRVIFNEAISDGVISPVMYPFGKKKYRIPTGRNIKKALTSAEIGKIYYYELETEHKGEMRAKGLLVIQLLCQWHQ
jgi:hypothetical protein